MLSNWINVIGGQQRGEITNQNIGRWYINIVNKNASQWYILAMCSFYLLVLINLWPFEFFYIKLQLYVASESEG